jgi:YD repeat-containing protein
VRRYRQATQVRDAKGQIFETVYDLDGLVQSITRIDTTPSIPLMSVP